VSRRAFLVALPALAASACGYALVGRGGGSIDPSIKRIGVPLFLDRTGKPRIDQKVTQKVIEELLKRGKVDVVSQRDGVDAIVEGELIAYDAAPIGFSDDPTANPGAPAGATTQASHYGITLTARVKWTKTGVREPMWVADAYSVRDEYELGNDPATFFDKEEQAIDRLTTVFARNLVAAMLEAF
jgi:hypothetical protein